MSKINFSDVNIEELYPEKIYVGEHAFRLITFTDDGIPNFEFYKIPYEGCDTGNIESGPSLDIFLGDPVILAKGYGIKETIEDLIRQYFCKCNKATCNICHPDAYIGY